VREPGHGDSRSNQLGHETEFQPQKADMELLFDH
jgi:hypothetical protein